MLLHFCDICLSSREECNEYIDSVWKWLEGLGSGIKRDDPKTWTQPHWPDTHKGIFNILEVAHQDFVWRVRKHPRLLHVSLTLQCATLDQPD